MWQLPGKLSLYFAIVGSEIENQDQCHLAPLPEIYMMRLFLDS